MKLHFSFLMAICLFVVACSPSLEEVEGIVSSYIAYQETGDLFGGDGTTSVSSIEQTDKNIYSGTYTVAQDAHTKYAYPFTAIIKKDQVSKFFKDTDETKVMVITVKPEALAKGEDEISEADLVYEAKKDYDERIRREEEERQAAIAASRRRASGSDLGKIGADYLLAHKQGVVQIISYRKASTSLFGGITYTYKVLEANGLGTNTVSYDVEFKNGKIFHIQRDGISGQIDAIANFVPGL